MSLLLASLLLSFFPSYAAEQGEKGVADDIMESGPLTPTREEVPGEEEGAPVAPEDLETEQEAPAAPEEGEEAATPTPVMRPPAGLPAEEGAVAGGEAGEGNESREIVIDSLVNLNYIFNGSPDSFILKYHVHLEGKLSAATAVVKGNASIATEVTGYLAKWPTGECKLTVTVPDSPFQMTFRKTSEDKANVDLKFTNPILETWDSQCNFKDAPDAKFNTKGDPEKWLGKAFEKARPPLARMTVDLNPDESTSLKIVIPKQTIKDPPLGSAEVEGTGVVTINPGAGG